MENGIYSIIEIPGSDRVGVFNINTLQYEIVNSKQEASAIAATGMPLDKAGGAAPVGTSPFPAEWRGPGIKRSATLMATMACNLRCTYCYMKDDPQFLENSKMTFETARTCLLKSLHPSVVDHLQISFLGGEPTLNMELVFRTMHWMRKTYRKSSFCITTNATRLHLPLRDHVDFELVEGMKDITVGEWLAYHKFDALISMDGNEAAHDAGRVNAAGTGSFADVMKALKFMRERAPKWVARRTLRGSYGNELATGVPLLDRLQFFNGLIREGIGCAVVIEPGTIDPKNFPAIAAQYADAVEWFISETKAGQNPKWHDMTDAVRKLYLRQPRRQFCGAGAGKMAFGVDGEIHACHNTSTDSEVGTIEKGVDPDRMARWADVLDVDAVPQCATCDLRYYCAGGCRAKNFSEHGIGTKPTDTTCFMATMRMGSAFRIIDCLTSEQLDTALGIRKRIRA